jgi:hypothetical protein
VLLVAAFVPRLRIKMPSTSLGAAEHRMVQELIQQYEAGDDNTKIVAIRDLLADAFKAHILTWRLLPDQIGIHPTNRDFIKLTAGGCQLRGKKYWPQGSVTLQSTPYGPLRTIHQQELLSFTPKTFSGHMRSSPHLLAWSRLAH